MSGRPFGRLRRVQDELDTFIEQLQAIPLPSLGQEFLPLRGTLLADSLVRHRLLKMYEVPNEGDAKLRADRSIKAMLQYDAGTSFTQSWSYRKLQTAMDRKRFLEAKDWLAGVLKNFRLPQTASRFPSGESCVASGGLVDFADKLALESQWTISAGCLEYAAELAYNTAALKRVVRARFREQYPVNTMREAWGCFSGEVCGKSIFKKMFKCLVSIEPGRISTVRKNNETDRVISMEPTWTMICQLQLSQDLRRCLKDATGIDLDIQARCNGAASALEREHTIDFTNASNSCWMSVIRDLWPPRIYSKLSAFRSSVFTYKEGKRTCYTGLNMLSPMGNGFTFEVMTLTILALSRTFDDTSFVFGDDLIMRGKDSADAIIFLGKLGWVVNYTKSFTEGNFRESCGAFWDVSIPDEPQALLSYEAPRPECVYDVTVYANKLCHILLKNQLSLRMRQLLLRAYCRIIAIMGESFLTPIVNGEIDLGFGMIYAPVGHHTVWGTPDRSDDLYRLRCDQYHRPFNYGKRVFRIPVKVCRNYSEQVEYARFLKSGTSGAIPIKETQDIICTVDSLSGMVLTDYPLISVI